MIKALITLVAATMPALVSAGPYIPPDEDKEPFTAMCTATPRIQYQEIIAVPPGTTKLQVEQAIKSTLVQTNGSAGPSGDWFYEYTRDDVVYAGFKLRSHYVRLAIKFDENIIVSAVCDSNNVDQTTYSIHRNVPVWKTRLDSVILREIAVAANRTIPAEPSSSSNMDNAIRQLEKLKELRDAGILDESEYTQMKTNIMNQVL